MKVSKIFTMIFALMIMLGGCAKPQGDIYQRINKQYSNLNSYYAKCTAKVTGNKTENTYDFEVFYKSPDKIKLLFSPNNIGIVINGNETHLENKLIGHTIHLDGEGADYPNFIINTFFKNYFVGESASVDVSSFPKGNYTYLECELPEGNDYACTQKLCIDNDTTHPVSLTTYNAKGDAVIEVEFIEFSFNDARVNNVFN